MRHSIKARLQVRRMEDHKPFVAAADYKRFAAGLNFVGGFGFRCCYCHTIMRKMAAHVYGLFFALALAFSGRRRVGNTGP